MNRVYIAIGSNLNNPIKQAKNAIESIKKLPNTAIISVSSFYRSKPIAFKNQPNYLNAVISLNTKLKPEILLKYIQLIELKQGRKRNKKWDSRTIDLDIILYGKKIIKKKNLTIPHYDVNNRIFVLLPLLEIEPKLYFPDGTSISKKIELIQKKEIEIW